MAAPIDFNCGNIFSQFGNEDKFAEASKNFLQNRSKLYKLSKYTVKYLFAIAEVGSLIPLDCIPPFRVIQSIASVVFEGWKIHNSVGKIHRNRERLLIAKEKIEKKDPALNKNFKERKLDACSLRILKGKYQNKLTDLKNKEEKEKSDKFRQQRWDEYIELINKVLIDGDQRAVAKLQKQFASRRNWRLEQIRKEEAALERRIKKSYLSIAISVGSIALEALTITATIFTCLDGGITFTAIRIGSDLTIFCLRYGKYLWWNISNGERKGVIALKSIEYLGTLAAKMKILPFPTVFHPFLIKGACKATLCFGKILGSSYNLLDNRQAINQGREQVDRLKKERVSVLKVSRQLRAGNEKVMRSVQGKYSSLNKDAKEIIGQYKTQLALGVCDEGEKDELEAVIGIMQADIKKRETYINALDKALQTHAKRDAETAADLIAKPTIREISNWKLSEKLNKTNNLKEGLKIALSIVEVARFAFLVIAVSLALVGLGVNLLPFLFVSAFFANVLYIGYFWLNGKINQKIDSIVDVWKSDEIPSGC